MHKGYAFVQFTNPFDARSACLGEDGRTVLGQILGEYKNTAFLLFAISPYAPRSSVCPFSAKRTWSKVCSSALELELRERIFNLALKYLLQ